jgi:hypothetical protein
MSSQLYWDPTVAAAFGALLSAMSEPEDHTESMGTIGLATVSSRGAALAMASHEQTEQNQHHTEEQQQLVRSMQQHKKAPLMVPLDSPGTRAGNGRVDVAAAAAAAGGAAGGAAPIPHTTLSPCPSLGGEREEEEEKENENKEDEEEKEDRNAEEEKEEKEETEEEEEDEKEKGATSEENVGPVATCEQEQQEQGQGQKQGLNSRQQARAEYRRQQEALQRKAMELLLVGSSITN